MEGMSFLGRIQEWRHKTGNIMFNIIKYYVIFYNNINIIEYNIIIYILKYIIFNIILKIIL